MSTEAAVLYHEPGIVTILTQSSLILILNVIAFLLDKAIYCGLIGQILVGMVYGLIGHILVGMAHGTPGGDILGTDLQQAITDLGYIGLILLVFEGGLSTHLSGLRSNLVLSTFVALTGIMLPIAMSFLLIKISNASILQAFSAGAALSSTSLGTTFTILKTSGLDKSRLGVVLTSAAMLDDVVGLVLVQVISNLGSGGGGVSATTIIRPVFVSLAYAIATIPFLYLIKRLKPAVLSARAREGKCTILLFSSHGQFVMHTLILLAAISSATYAGTSNLFAAYLAGLLVAACHEDTEPPAQPNHNGERPGTNSGKATAVPDKSTGAEDSREMVKPQTGTPDVADNVNKRSEEISPKSESDRSSPSPVNVLPSPNQIEPSQYEDKNLKIYREYFGSVVERLLKPFFFASIGFSIPITRLFDGPTLWRGFVYAALMTLGKLACGLWLIRLMSTTPTTQSNKKDGKAATTWQKLLSYRPQSLYPGMLLGGAMVARGEIGFLISALAQSNGIFEQEPGEPDLFLVVTWAILLCTIIGPVAVGMLTRRVKRLRKAAANSEGGKQDPLGVWADL